MDKEKLGHKVGLLGIVVLLVGVFSSAVLDDTTSATIALTGAGITLLGWSVM